MLLLLRQLGIDMRIRIVSDLYSQPLHKPCNVECAAQSGVEVDASRAEHQRCRARW